MFRSLASRILLTTATWMSAPRASFWRDVSMLEDKERQTTRLPYRCVPPAKTRCHYRTALRSAIVRLASQILPLFGISLDKPIRMPPPPDQGFGYWPVGDPISDDEVVGLILAVPAHYLTRTISNSGGTRNWNDTASWVEAAFPIAGDAVVATGSSGSLTVNVASATASMILTGYTSTITFNSTLTVTSTVTLAGTIAGTAGTLILNTGGYTITSNGKTLTCALTFGASATYTLADQWTVNGLVTAGVTSGTTTINSSSNALICAGGFHLAGTSATVTGTGKITMAGGTWDRAGTGGLSKAAVDLAGNVTISGTVKLDGTNLVLTYVSGTITVAGSIVSISTGTATFATAGMTFATVQFAVAGTFTLNSLLSASQITLPNAAAIFAGTAGFTCGTLTNIAYTVSQIVTLQQGNTYTVTGNLTNVGTTATFRQSIISSSAGNKVVFILSPGATQDLIYCDPTDLNSSDGQTIFSARGTITTTTNWTTSAGAVVGNQPVGQACL